MNILANPSIDPSTYEIINPADFGMTRYVHFASRLTGMLSPGGNSRLARSRLTIHSL